MIKATVRWFDNVSQEGMIRLPDGSSVYVNNDPVTGHMLMHGKALDLKSGDAVMVEIYEDYNWRQVARLADLKTLDALQIDNLNRSARGELIGE